MSRLASLVSGLAVVALITLGLGIPLVAFDDCRCDVTPVQRGRLRTQAAHRLEMPALRLQVVEASAPTDDPDAARGIVAIRGPFGIRTGEVDFQVNGQGDIRRSFTREAGAWGLLVLVVAGVGATGVVCAVRA